MNHADAFCVLQEIRICEGANNSDDAISGIDRLMIPLKRNRSDGTMESASARKSEGLRKHIAHMTL